MVGTGTGVLRVDVPELQRIAGDLERAAELVLVDTRVLGEHGEAVGRAAVAAELDDAVARQLARSRRSADGLVTLGAIARGTAELMTEQDGSLAGVLR